MMHRTSNRALINKGGVRGVRPVCWRTSMGEPRGFRQIYYTIYIYIHTYTQLRDSINLNNNR